MVTKGKQPRGQFNHKIDNQGQAKLSGSTDLVSQDKLPREVASSTTGVVTKHELPFQVVEPQAW